MRFEDWAKNGWLETHRASREEIQNLLCIVKRDLENSHPKMSQTIGVLPSHTTPLCRQLRRRWLLLDTVLPAIATTIGSSVLREEVEDWVRSIDRYCRCYQRNSSGNRDASDRHHLTGT
jgi:hypothetical protein